MQENNKRIAKNTVFLYIRMLLNMAIAFYTSRVVLNTLGVDDFGIYGVVGGVIAMFGFLNSSMAGATSRFLTFELGRQDYERLQKTFSAALTVHFIIAIIILVLSETAGLWWLENKLVIAPERMNAARWVFHLSVISSVIGITQVPYNATIIAHERMNVYAYIEILNSLLKLGIVFLLVVGNFDKLILYAVLTMCVSIVVTTVYRAYCLQNFTESKYKFEWDTEIIKPMLNFSGWGTFGELSLLLKGQGLNMLLNMFFGVVVNAAYSIATQINNAILQFSNSFLDAIRPQITKYYAVGNINKMQSLIINASKISFFCVFLVSAPLIIENQFVLQLWLKTVPDYAVFFSQMSIIITWGASIMLPVRMGVQAVGKLKFQVISVSIVYFLILPTAYIFCKFGFSPSVIFIINVVMYWIGLQFYLWSLHKNIPQFSIVKFYYKVMLICVIFMFVVMIIPFYFHYTFEQGWKRMILVTVSEMGMAVIIGYFLILNRNLKKEIHKKLSFLKRF